MSENVQQISLGEDLVYLPLTVCLILAHVELVEEVFLGHLVNLSEFLLHFVERLQIVPILDEAFSKPEYSILVSDLTLNLQLALYLHLFWQSPQLDDLFGCIGLIALHFLH